MRMFRAALSVCAATLVAGCMEFETLRYRATVTFKVGGEYYTGSAVRNLDYSFQHWDFGRKYLGHGFRGSGDAITVDLGEGRNALFFLTRQKAGHQVFRYLVHACFKIDVARRNWLDNVKRIPVGAKCSVRKAKYAKPLIVSFLDEAVPQTVFEATPTAYKRLFGDGIEFLGMRVERLDNSAPVDEEIEQRLPWLKDIPFEGNGFRTLEAVTPGSGTTMANARLAQRITDTYFTGKN